MYMKLCRADAQEEGPQTLEHLEMRIIGGIVKRGWTRDSYRMLQQEQHRTQAPTSQPP